MKTLYLFTFITSFSRVYVVSDSLEEACKEVFKINKSKEKYNDTITYLTWSLDKDTNLLTISYKRLKDLQKDKVFTRVYKLESITEELPFVMEVYEGY